MSRTSLVALLALLASPALAFAPHDSGADGLNERVLRFDPHAQASLDLSPFWQKFVQGEGADWQAQWDQQTRTPHRMWGAPIDLGPSQTALDVEVALIGFADRHADLLGVRDRKLAPRSANYEPLDDTWYVELDVLVGGAPIEGGGITARFVHGALVMVGAHTYPDAQLEGTRRLSAQAATERALALGPAPGAAHTDVSTQLVALPTLLESGTVLRPAWRVDSRTATPPGIWETWIDAESGELVGARNHVRYIDATVSAEHDTRTVNGDTAVSPLPYVRVSDGNGVVNADDHGTVTIGGGTATATLHSPYFRVFNADGPDAELSFSGSAALFDGESSTAAERATYVFLHRIRDWGEEVAPGVVDDRLDAAVNLDQTCNAFFDGGVNFFRAGSGCNNTGRISDVVFHEWGHGFHYYSLRAGNYDGSLGEGAADVVAFLQTGDPVIAPYFMTNGQGIRNVSPNRVYPDDYNASDQYVHSNGLIFGGAMWDLWDLLSEDMGKDAAKTEVEVILAGLLRGGPGVAESYAEAILADDRDGNPSNGTPNECAIIEAFGLHGLGPLGSGTTFVAHHEPGVAVEPGVQPEIEVDLLAASERCYTFEPSAATLHYRIDAGTWASTLLDLDGDTAIGVMPAQEIGTLVEYYVEVTDDAGDASTAPDGGIINPFTLYVGDVLPIWCPELDEEDGGFTHELLAGEAREGADDWMWGTPTGLSGDPDHAHTGNRVWGNDLGGGNYNGAYQDDKHNRLTGPEIETAHYEGVFLNYWRWLTVEDGFYDQARILANDEVVWSNWENPNAKTDHTQDTQWMPHAVDLGGRADRGAVTLAWEIQSDGGLSFGGWNIDDVCLYAPATADNRLGITDFVAQGDGDSVIDVSWTHPIHAPLERVVVVRATDDWPGSLADGDIVYDDTTPELGATAAFSDDGVKRRGAYYYAVYAFDGDEWLGWTLPGWNADLAAVDGDPESQLSRGSCGCTTGLPASAPLFGMLLVGLLGLRRRRG